MIAEALKKALLQAAIQGKLTEQLPEDGDARDLLKEIHKEKARLVKEGKIKKEKPLPDITEDEIPFDIPENWAWARLSELVWLGNGDKKTGIKLPYLEAKVLRGQKKSFFETSGEVVYAGERIILVDGENSGEVFEVPFDGYLGSTFKKLVFASTSAVPFILIFLKKYQYLFKNNKTGSAIPHLNKTLFRELLTPLPPLAEQKRIVEKLESLLLKIEALQVEENKLDKLEKAFPGKIRASILQAAIQGKLTEQLLEDGDARDLLKEIQKEKACLIKEGKLKKDKPLPEITEDEIPFDIPERWTWSHLSFVTTSISAKPFQIFEKEISSEGLYPVVSQGKKLIEGYSNCQEKLLIHEKPIIVFGDHTKNLKLIDFDFIVGADGTKLLQPLGVLPDYLFWNLQYNVFSIGTRNYGRHFNLLSSVPIAVPPIEEQKRIVDKLEELLPLCERLE